MKVLMIISAGLKVVFWLVICFALFYAIKNPDIINNYFHILLK
jgi:hypothetical protein